MKQIKHKKWNTGIGQLFKILKNNYKKNWKLSNLLFISTIVVVGIQVMIPILTNQMTLSIMKDNFDESNSLFWNVHWTTLLYITIGLAIFSFFQSYLWNFLAFVLGTKIEINLRNELLEKLIRQDLSYYSDKKIGEVLTNVIEDTEFFKVTASTIPMQSMFIILQFTGSISIMYVLDWKLASIALAAYILIILALLISQFFIAKNYNYFLREYTDANGIITDRIGAISLIKANGTEKYEAKYAKNTHNKLYKIAMKYGKVSPLLPTFIFGGSTFLNLTVIVGAILIYGNSNNPLEINLFFSTTFVAFMLFVGILNRSLFILMDTMTNITKGSVIAKRIQKVLDAQSILDSHYFDGIKIDEIKGDIIFKNIIFNYPEKPEKEILPVFNFTFKKGKNYAIVGETGSGKSTISKLLLRFYDPTSGKIIINENIDLKDVHLKSYLDHVGYIEQEPQIIYGDVYENVKYGSFDATDEQVIEACKKAELDKIIQTWPEKYNTILGERGFLLSGGQKQRLVIARMFLKNPSVLILDEATSALDNIVEKTIQQKIEQLSVGKTTITIAHRLSTIKHADEIIVLEPGKGIVQIGNFNELKTQPGHFKNLYQAGLMN